MAELLTLVPPWVAVKVTIDPWPPFVVRLIVFPVQESHDTVTFDDCPTVTVADPLAVPDVAVMVTPVVVLAMPLINPLLLTVT